MFVVTTILCTDMFRSTDSLRETFDHVNDLTPQRALIPDRHHGISLGSHEQKQQLQVIFHHVSNILSDGHPEKHGSSAMKGNGCLFRPENNAQCFVTACG